jgi:selenocysteine lyase/cysteine desulfurase
MMKQRHSTTAPFPLTTSSHAKQVQDYLYHHHHIEVPIKSVDGQLYVRVSFHIYNTIDDFDRLAQALVQFPIHTLV